GSALSPASRDDGAPPLGIADRCRRLLLEFEARITTLEEAKALVRLLEGAILPLMDEAWPVSSLMPDGPLNIIPRDAPIDARRQMVHDYLASKLGTFPQSNPQARGNRELAEMVHMVVW